MKLADLCAIHLERFPDNGYGIVILSQEADGQLVANYGLEPFSLQLPELADDWREESVFGECFGKAVYRKINGQDTEPEILLDFTINNGYFIPLTAVGSDVLPAYVKPSEDKCISCGVRKQRVASLCRPCDQHRRHELRVAEIIEGCNNYEADKRKRMVIEDIRALALALILASPFIVLFTLVALKIYR